MGHKIVVMQVARADRHLRLALALTVVVLIVEVLGGLLAHSLALLSDAGHVLTDIIVLALSTFAVNQAGRSGNARRTFGYQRVGILIALLNGLILGLIVVGIAVEAVRRIQNPGQVNGALMAGTAAIGLAISLFIAMTLRRHDADLTVRSALVHVWGDAWAAAGAIVAGVVIIVGGWQLVDPLLSLGIAALIAWSAWRVMVAAVNILLESMPADVRTESVLEAVKKVPGVRDLHDLHVWSLSAQSRAMSAHLLVDDQRVAQAQDILAEVREVLAHDFSIEHTTIQFESLECRPGDIFCVQPDGHPHAGDAHDRITRRAAG